MVQGKVRMVTCRECGKRVPEGDIVYVGSNRGDMYDPGDDFEYASAYPICLKCTNNGGAVKRVTLAILSVLAFWILFWLVMKYG